MNSQASRNALQSLAIIRDQENAIRDARNSIAAAQATINLELAKVETYVALVRDGLIS